MGSTEEVIVPRAGFAQVDVMSRFLEARSLFDRAQYQEAKTTLEILGRTGFPLPQDFSDLLGRTQRALGKV